jgi:hypothetical protein
MGWLRMVVGVAVLWLLSIVVTIAGLEIAHRSVLAAEHRASGSHARGSISSATRF